MKALIVATLLTATVLGGDLVHERIKKKIPECTQYIPLLPLMQEYIKVRRSKMRVVREIDEVLDLIKLVKDPEVRKRTNDIVNKALIRARKNGFKKPLKVYFMESLLCRS